MKRIIALLCLLGPTFVYANPFTFGAYALYIQPDLNSLNFRGTVISDGLTHSANYDPRYNLGYKIEGAYRFDKNDINLNGTHFQATYQKSFHQIIGNEGDLLEDFHSSITPSLTAINLELGQIYTSEQRALRLHGGIQYAHVSTNENSDVELLITNMTLANSKFVTRHYDGAGLRFGADVSQRWNNGFSIFGNVAMALLFGNQSSNTQFSENLFATRELTTQTIGPELEAKAGLTYAFLMQQETVAITAGWMFLNYFSATLYDNYNLASNLVIENHPLSFGLQGPYLGLKWLGK